MTTSNDITTSNQHEGFSPYLILSPEEYEEMLEETALTAALTPVERAIDDAAKFCGSYSRLPTLLEYMGACDDSSWLRLLGRHWFDCDNISEHIDELEKSPLLSGGVKTQPDMMTPKELAALDAMPDTFRIYRGCYRENKWGLSWTTDLRTAMRFPFLTRYRSEGQSILVTAEVKKANVIALKLDRNESEIITKRPKHISTRCLWWDWFDGRMLVHANGDIAFM